MFEELMKSWNRLLGLNEPDYIPPPPKPVPAKEHPVTIDEIDRLAALTIIAGAPGRIHRNFVEERRHQEILQAIKDRR